MQQARRPAPEKTARPLVIPHWFRGLALVVVAGVLLEAAAADLTGFARAALLLPLYVLVVAAAADVVWHLWTTRRPAPIAALTGAREMVPAYGQQVRLWVTAIALAAAAVVSVLHGGQALLVLRAWVKLHRWAPPEIASRIVPSTIDAHQPFHVSVTVDRQAGGGYRCEWQGRFADWAPGPACDVRAVPPQHFVEADWPTRRVAVSARVYEGDRFLGSTPTQMLTINYAPMIDLIGDRQRIIRGQRAQFRVTVDGHAPRAEDHCRWSVGGRFVSSESCVFAYTGTDVATPPSSPLPIGVEVENASNGSVGTAEAALLVDQPRLYTLYLIDASKRMAGETATGTLLDNVRSDLVDGWSRVDLAGSYLGIGTFGADAARPRCYENVQVPYPVQRLNVSEAKSVLFLVQPGGAQAPFGTALLRGLTLLRAAARGAGPRGSFVLAGISGGQDSCGAPPAAAEEAWERLMDQVRSTAAGLDGRLLALTIGVGTSDVERRTWDALARGLPGRSPYVIIPAPNVPALDQALRLIVALSARDYNDRIAACADLTRILGNAGYGAGAGQVHRFCETLSTP